MYNGLSKYKMTKLYEVEKKIQNLNSQLKELKELENKYKLELLESNSPSKGSPVKGEFKDMHITISFTSGRRSCKYQKLLELSEDIYKEVVSEGSDGKKIVFSFK